MSGRGVEYLAWVSGVDVWMEVTTPQDIVSVVKYRRPFWVIKFFIEPCCHCDSMLCVATRPGTPITNLV